MELKIVEPIKKMEKISWNFEEFKKAALKKAEQYKSLAYTEDQVGEAKKDRAELNNNIKQLEDARKSLKKEYMSTYNVFETEVKEVVEVFNSAVTSIDAQVKEYENFKRNEKQEKINEAFIDAAFPEWVELEKIQDSKWLNATVTMKKVTEALETKKNTIENDVATLEKLPEFSFEAIESYKNSMNLASAINEGQRLAEIAKRKVESMPPSATMTPPAAPIVAEPNDMQSPLTAEPTKMWITFCCNLTFEDSEALTEFLKSRNIEFEQR